jgi:hypothetical protein
MNRKVAVTFALGWYLLIPNAPANDRYLATWEQIGAYDTAKECQIARMDLLNQAAKSKDKALEENKMRLARCIETSDPRLQLR